MRLVGVVAERSAVPILMEGLRRLEYRGYDSAGLAVLDHGELARVRTVGKVQMLQSALDAKPIHGSVGIAHTRWATHGVPTTENAHPHVSRGNVAIVHNGIIENHETLRTKLKGLGYVFTSETDTEVIAHQIHHHLASSPDLFTAVRKTVAELKGAYALAVLSEADPECIVMAREGCPAVIGLGIDENFAASDVAALLPVTRRFMFLEEGDVAEVRRRSVKIVDAAGNLAARAIRESDLPADCPSSAGSTGISCSRKSTSSPAPLRRHWKSASREEDCSTPPSGPAPPRCFKRVKAVHIAACGTSFHAGIVASYLIEQICRIPARVEVASEYRYRDPVITPDTLFVTISQSGETADTLAALRNAKQAGYLATLTICNVAESSMVRESNLVLLTRAGPEIGVASTKAFTTQLTALTMLTIALAKNGPAASQEGALVSQLLQLPGLVEKTLNLDAAIQALAEVFVEKHHALFLGRGPLQAIAMEGALKLKEISYIHAEGYPAAELKHGPLALVDEDMPVVAVAPSNDLLEKLKSNLHEVRARGGKLYVFADPEAGMESEEGITVIKMPVHATTLQAPVIFAIPMQLLAYHVAVLKGTDVDQPRNLAKSLTVE